MGGSLEPKSPRDSGFPGPGSYNKGPLSTVPGFMIFDLDKHTKPRRSDLDRERRQRTIDVGPLSYSPKHVSLYRTDNLKKNSIGNS